MPLLTIFGVARHFLRISAHCERLGNHLFGLMIVTTVFCWQGKSHLFKRYQYGDVFVFAPANVELTSLRGFLRRFVGRSVMHHVFKKSVIYYGCCFIEARIEL